MFQGEDSESTNILSTSTSEAVPLLNPPTSPRLARSMGATQAPARNLLKRETAKVIERKRRKDNRKSLGATLDEAPKVKIDWLQNFEIKTSGDEEPVNISINFHIFL